VGSSGANRKVLVKLGTVCSTCSTKMYIYLCLELLGLLYIG